MLDKPTPPADETTAAPRLDPAKTLAVLIVGMHRSGTSALGGVLNLLGVAVPEDLFPADQHNTRGYFEPERIIDFHEALLAKLGSPSNDPLPLTYDWVKSPIGQAAAAELAGILDEEFGDNAMCLFKDPRMCRLAPVWTAALALEGRPGVAVLPCRHPLEVAESLRAKGALSRPYALFMWLQHVLLGERFTRDLPRSFTFYDALVADWRGVVDKLQRELGIAWPRDPVRAAPEIDAFLTPDLRHHASRSDTLTAHDALDGLCARAWTALHSLVDAPYDAAAMAEMDAIWAALEAAVGVSAPLVVSFQHDVADLRDHLQRTLKDVDQIVREGTEAVQTRDRRIIELDRAHQVVRQRLDLRQAELDAALRQMDAEIRRRDDDIILRDSIIRERDAYREAEIQWRDAEIQRRDADILRLDAALDRQNHELAAHSANLVAAWARASAIENSTSWKLATALRAPLVRMPGLRRLVRGMLKSGWWVLTFQLGRKLAERRAFFAAAAAANAAPPPPPPPAEPAPPPSPTLDAEAFTETAIEPAPDTEPEPAPEPEQEADPAPERIEIVEIVRLPHVVFLSGEASTPGHTYRIERYAEAAVDAGARATIVRLDDVEAHLEALGDADLLFIWRAAWNEKVELAVDTARAGGAKVLFDIDDLLMEPELAKAEIIDGIRSQRFSEESVREHFLQMERTHLSADYCSAPTEFLAGRLRRRGQPAFVLPNGFNDAVRERTRLAARLRRQQPDDGLVRIGYATGSKTHQKDFGAAAEAIARILREHPQARLVAFRGHWGDVLDVAEFPALDGLVDQIEWREVVPIQQLPDEMARFDINLAPLEVGNIFCESKSELKFFEAALAGVPTVASPTGAFKKAIRHGETGFLANSVEEWYAALKQLVADPDLRRRIARAGEIDALANYGPELRAEAMTSVLDQVLSRGRRAARAFELDITRAGRPKTPIPHIPDHEVVLEIDHVRPSQATVIVPLYNYAGFVEEALESVCAQTVEDLDLVVVDDASTDGSLEVARRWIEGAQDRFNRVVLVKNRRNSGLAFTRNVAFANTDTPFVLPLDADNKLMPTCVEALLGAIQLTGAAFAYPQLSYFGEDGPVGLFVPYDPARFVAANYVDAMALVRRAAWAAAGGYDHVRYGWEDYDFWCRLVERGMFGQFVEQPLAQYRIHGASMLRSETDTRRNKLRLIADIERRHPWLDIDRDPWRGAKLVADEPAAPPPPVQAERTDAERQTERLDRVILPLLRDPATGAALQRDGETLKAEGGARVWPLVLGRPVLFDGLQPQVFPAEHISNPLPERAVAMIEATEGPVLNLSAGGTPRRYDHVIEAEVGVFAHTDVIADVHALPFADGVFDLVVSMNAFEHYHTPAQAAAEIMRVLKPGGRVLIHTAFMQPLHEAPWHFYNATRYGLERWFAAFETEALHVSENFNPIYALTWQMSAAEAALRRELGGGDAERLLDSPVRDLVQLWRDPAARGDGLWRSFHDLPQAAQEELAAGFEFLGRKPG